MKRVLLVLFALVLIGILTATAALLYRTRHPGGAAAPRTVVGALSGDAVASGGGERIKVEVLNATPERGLARRVTFLLRDAGFDVVQMGNAAGGADSTVVLDRSKHPDWARRAAAALGHVRVIERPDSSRYLDVTVLLGRTWRAPAQPFDP